MSGEEPLSDREARGIVLLLSAQVSLIMLGLGLVTPILPIYAQSFGVGAAAVGSLVTVFGIARMFVNIPAGQWTDRFGRKGLLVAGPLLTAAGAVGFAFAGSFAQLLLWRVVQGVGSAVLTTAAMVAVADISRPQNRGRIMSMYQDSLLLGAGAGPAAGRRRADSWLKPTACVLPFSPLPHLRPSLRCGPSYASRKRAHRQLDEHEATMA